MNRLWKFNCRLAGRKIAGGGGEGMRRPQDLQKFAEIRERGSEQIPLRRCTLYLLYLTYTSLRTVLSIHERDAEFLIAPNEKTAVYTRCKLSILSLPRV